MNLPYTLHAGDCREVMATFDAESIDAIVTDPPYGLSFMGREWDHGVPGVPFWAEVLRVAKPGAHLLAFGGSRTFHRLTCAVEEGFRFNGIDLDARHVDIAERRLRHATRQPDLFGVG